MPGNTYSEEDWARLRWVEHRIGQLTGEWRTHATQLRRQSQPRGPELVSSRAGDAAEKVEACIRDVEEMLNASHLPGGPPLDAAYMAGQVMYWTRMLEQLAGTVDAEIIDEDEPTAAGQGLAQGLAQWQPSTFAQYAGTTGRDPIPEEEQFAAAARYMAGELGYGQPQPEEQPGAASAVTTGSGYNPIANVLAAGTAAGMVQVSAQDLRDALEDWGYEGPVSPVEGDGDLPVFRLTRAAYGPAEDTQDGDQPVRQAGRRRGIGPLPRPEASS